MEMELSQLSESFIGGIGVSKPTMVPETAIQRWRRLKYLVLIMNRKPLQVPPSLTELEKFRVAVLTIHSANLFTNGLDHSQVEEQTEDINVASSYSANDSDGPSTVIVPPPTDQIVVDIVHVGSRRNISGDQEMNTSRVWIIVSGTGFGFEFVSAYFDQAATPQKLHYAFLAMLVSIFAVVVCILELIYNAVKQRKASASDMLWGILPEIFGLALAYIQCITATLHYSFLRRKATYPIRVSLVPFLCLIILFAFKYRSGRN